MAAGMILAGADKGRAIDFVRSASSNPKDSGELSQLSQSALLWTDLRGELMMLAEDLEPDAVRPLLRSLNDLAASSDQPALAFDLVDYCSELLGAR